MADNLEWAVRLLEVLDLLVAQLDAHARCNRRLRSACASNGANTPRTEDVLEVVEARRAHDRRSHACIDRRIHPVKISRA